MADAQCWNNHLLSLFQMNNRFKSALSGFIFFLLTGMALSAESQTPVPVDSTYSLLNNPFIQMEATQAINDMYDFRFERSMSHFNYLRKEYGWHPLPYFLMGLNYFWRILPDFDNHQYDKKFYAYMDTSMVYAERLYKKLNKVEGAFFLAATYAFQARLYSERHDWTKAAFAGKSALKYLDECKGYGDLSPELLFGDALFNYYREWVPDNYPLLKPIMAMFPKGDRKKGIEQLKTVARNAFYTRTEAQYYLMRILYYEEKDIMGAMQLGEYLHVTFPHNAYFHRFYARLLYQTGRYTQAANESRIILDRIDSAYAGYENNSGRYAAFFLGHINEIRKHYDEAEKYYKMTIQYAQTSDDATELGYYIYSILHLGKIAEIKGKKKEAIRYYKEVREITSRKHAANQEARERLKKLD